MDDALTARYPWYLQTLPVLTLLTGGAMVCGLGFGCWDTWGKFHSDDLRYAWPLLAIYLFVYGIVGPTVVYIFYRMLCSSWLLLYTYRLSGDVLEARDPVLRKHYAVRLADVERARWFLLGGPRQVDAMFGRSLETASGKSLVLCDALPLWPEIKHRCTRAEIEERPPDPLRMRV